MIFRSTTILGVRHKGISAMAGDGQVTFGDTVLKTSARKIRKMYDDTILVGFAGAAADALTLFEKFEAASSIHPRWGIHQANFMISECEKENSN